MPKNKPYLFLFAIALLLLAVPAFAVHPVTKIRIGNGELTPAVNPATQRLYLADLAGSLAVVDTSTNVLLTTIPLAGSAVHVAVNPVTNMIYVASDSTSSGSVIVINGADNSLVTTIPIGQQALGVAVNTTTNRVYVLDENEKFLAVIDGNTNAVIDTVSLTLGARYIVVDSAANLIYVTGFTTAYVIDGNTDRVLNSVSATSSAIGIALDATRERLYLADQTFSGTLVAVDTATFTVVQTLGVTGIAAITVNPINGAILVPGDIANPPGRGIVSVNPSTFKVAGQIGVTNHNFYTGIVVDPDTGNWYATFQNGFTLDSGVWVFAP